MLHSWATDNDDATVDPRWGKVGKQRIEDCGTLYPDRMETVDDEILDHALKFIDKAKADNKPFFVWLNPTRMHVVTHLVRKVREHAHAGKRLERFRSRHGSTRRHRRRRDAKTQGRRSRRQHDRDVHHRQRRGELHLARRRSNAVCRRQRNRPRRRLPRAVHRALARQRARRQSRKRHDVPVSTGSRRLSPPPAIRTSSTSSRKANSSATGRIKSISTATTKWISSPVKVRRSDRVLLLRRRHAGRGARQRLQIPLHRSARRLARRYGQSRLADPYQSSARSVRTHRHDRLANVRTGSRTSSGVSSSCKKSSGSLRRPRSTFRRCKPVRPSISTPSKSRSNTRWPVTPASRLATALAHRAARLGSPILYLSPPNSACKPSPNVLRCFWPCLSGAGSHGSHSSHPKACESNLKPNPARNAIPVETSNDRPNV